MHSPLDQGSDQDGPDYLHGLIEPGECTKLAEGVGGFEAVGGKGDDRTIESDEESGHKGNSKTMCDCDCKYVRLEAELVLEEVGDH